jgi:hypothetical protein
MSSAVLVHTKGRARWFQPLMKVRMALVSSRTYAPEGAANDGLAFDDGKPHLGG